MQVQSYTRACPVCKAGVEVDKVRLLLFWACECYALPFLCACPIRSRDDKHTKQQVIPIYGRGSDFDPRQAEAIKVQPVPPRPAGQRPAPVQVRARSKERREESVDLRRRV